MYDEYGKPVNEAPPSTPVSVLGLSEPPNPGQRFEFVKNDKVARSLIAERQEAERVPQGAVARAMTLEDVFAQFAAGEAKELNLIVKADVQGSLEPVVDSLKKLGGEDSEIGIRILSADIGNVSENDVMLASASDAIILAFTVGVDNPARRAADSQGVDIRSYNIIYKLLEDVELALKGMLEPEYAPKTIGVVEVRRVFHISRGNIAGCYVREGEARRKASVRVKRKGETLVEKTSIKSLKRVKDDVTEVRTGFECGIALDGFDDFEEGDLLEFFVMERVN
jgi:translation initiation factor IF-2